MPTLTTTHAETAVLAYVLSDPVSGVPYSVRHAGMPDFDCSKFEARAAIDSLKQRGLLRKNGPYYNLTLTGTNLMQPVLEQLAA